MKSVNTAAVLSALFVKLSFAANSSILKSDESHVSTISIVNSIGESHIPTNSILKSGEVRPPTDLLKLDPLRSLQEICENPGNLEFLVESLGPDALADGSRFRNFGLLVTYNDGSQKFFPIPIDQLADSFNEFRLVDNEVFKPFVQENEFFGHNGEFTDELFFQHQLATEFWKLPEEGFPPIALAGLHGEWLKTELVTTFGLARYLAQQESLEDILPQIADDEFFELAQAAMLAIETELPGTYSNPALSFNAYATPVLPVTGFEGSALIVIGDGIMDYLISLGLGDITNDVLHAHEFGHVLQFIMAYEEAGGDAEQFINDLFLDITPEQSRKIELTADAYACYFLAHEQGRNFDLQSLTNAARAFFSVGDCETTSKSHHGTPEQRECASLWGAQLALSAAPGQDPVTFRELNSLFQQDLQAILDDDFSVCITDKLIESLGSGPPFWPSPALSGSFSNRVGVAGLLGAFVVSILMV